MRIPFLFELFFFGEGLVASGADHIFGLDFEIEADDFAAVRALCLNVFIHKATVAIFAVAVFVATVAIVTAELVVTIAVAIFAVTIALVVVAFENFAFNYAEVVVELFCIFFKLFEIVFDIVKLVDNVGYESDKLIDELCFGLGGIKIESLCEALDISTLFADVHFLFSNQLLSTFDVIAGSGVDLELITDSDEERNVDDSACLESARLLCGGSGIALYAGFGVRNLEDNEHRRLNGKYVSVIGEELANVIFLNELERVGKKACVDRDLLIGLGIHEVVKISVIVEIFHFLAVDARVLELICGAECTLDNCACHYVAELGANESRPLTGLYVLEFDYLKNGTVTVIKCNTVSEIACCYHIFYAVPPILRHGYSFRFSTNFLIIIYYLLFCNSF